MGKITIEVKINTFGTMLYSLNHPNKDFVKIIFLLPNYKYNSWLYNMKLWGIVEVSPLPFISSQQFPTTSLVNFVWTKARVFRAGKRLSIMTGVLNCDWKDVTSTQKDSTKHTALFFVRNVISILAN